METQTGERFFDTLVEELAKALGISESNQRVLLHRARTKVRQALAPYMEQADRETLRPWPLKQCA